MLMEADRHASKLTRQGADVERHTQSVAQRPQPTFTTTHEMTGCSLLGQLHLIEQPQAEAPVGDDLRVRVVQDIAVFWQARVWHDLEPGPVGKAADRSQRVSSHAMACPRMCFAHPIETHCKLSCPAARLSTTQKPARTVQLCWVGLSARGLPFLGRPSYVARTARAISSGS